MVSDLHDRMPDRTRRIDEAGLDIFTRQIGKVREQLVDPVTGAQRIENVGNAHPGSRDDRASAADFRVDDDARAHIKNVRGGMRVVKRIADGTALYAYP